MAHEKAPAFQFYPKDFLADGNQGEMTLQEVGAYIRLLCRCWTEQSIPDDAARAANLVGATPAKMRKMWPALRRCFRPVEGGRLIHPRLELERAKQEQYRRRQRQAGQASAATRRQPEGNHGSTTVQPEGNQEATECQPEGNSPISDLRSPIFVKSTHRRHTFCGVKFCVPMFLHEGFTNQLGEQGLAKFDLLEWYPTLDARYETIPIGGDVLGWVRKEFTAATRSLFGDPAQIRRNRMGVR